MSQFKISEIETRQMQLKGLNILIYFDKFCQKHKLTWFSAEDVALVQYVIKALFLG